MLGGRYMYMNLPIEHSHSIYTAHRAGLVPVYGQGLHAMAYQLGAIGTKDWLKSLKLHKYWPLISHMSYWQMMSLEDANIDNNIHLVGGTRITEGAKGRLLRSIQELRDRRANLMQIIEITNSWRPSLMAELSYIQRIVDTPMPTSVIDSLPVLVVFAVQKIKQNLSQFGNNSQYDAILNWIDWAIELNPVLYRANERLRQKPSVQQLESTADNPCIEDNFINADLSARSLPPAGINGNMSSKGQEKNGDLEKNEDQELPCASSNSMKRKRSEE